MKNILINILIFILLLNTACLKTQELIEDKMPGIDLSIGDMNKYFRIAINSVFKNDFKNLSVLELSLINLSDKSILIPLRSSVKIYSKENQAWVPIVNIGEYQDISLLLKDEKSDPGGKVLSVMPSIPGLQQKTTIKVVITGYFEGKSNNEIGSYIDLPLYP